jgi:hypothetical protein
LNRSLPARNLSPPSELQPSSSQVAHHVFQLSIDVRILGILGIVTELLGIVPELLGRLFQHVRLLWVVELWGIQLQQQRDQQPGTGGSKGM